MKSKFSFKAIALAVLLTLISTTVALAAAGVLDPTFDGDGRVVTNLGGEDSIQAMVIQPDGKIVVAGSSDEDFALARYDSNGALDASFGNNGIVITNIPGYSSDGQAVALQSDGKIILGGSICISYPDCDFALVRYNDNGSLDTGFDGDGIVITDFDYHGVTANNLSAIGIQADGKILVVGDTWDIPNFSILSLARYNSDGSLDASFDGDGKLTIHVEGASYSRALAFQPDGKFIVAGASVYGALDTFSKTFVARFNNDGTFDTSFNEKGYVIIDVPPQNESVGRAVALVPNGKIVVVGSVVEIGGYSGSMVVVRLNPNGSLDTTFGGDGIVVTDFGGTKGHQGGRAAAIQLDGKVVAAGKSNYLGTDDFALARYNRDGSLDTSFSGDGKVLTSIHNEDAAYAMSLQTDGSIVVAGSSDSNFALARYDDGGLAFLSTSLEDGWILESAENGNAGGTMNNIATTLRLGDDAARKQYRSILSFETSSLPDNAVITKVTLKVRRQGVSGGGDPISIFQGFMVDIKKGIFGSSSALQLTDWQAASQKTVGPFTPTLSGGWYSLDLTTAKAYINKLTTLSGLTQIRLRFKLDDNDNNTIANYLSLYSGNVGAASRPRLIIEYMVP